MVAFAMAAILPRPMSRDEFFAWAERQELPYEFDGTGPVPMTGGNAGHNRLILNLLFLLRGLLDGTGWEAIGPEAGVATVGTTVRYPDAVVTRTPFGNGVRLVPDPVAVFEVVSPTSGRTDRVVKLREYAAVPSILRYVILESASVDVTVFARLEVKGAFGPGRPPEDGTVRLPGIDTGIALADIYRGVLDMPGSKS